MRRRLVAVAVALAGLAGAATAAPLTAYPSEVDTGTRAQMLVRR